MGRVDGKVALITGAARGQGRSHAVRLAQEGAEIIAVDSCTDAKTAPYARATREDLDETARLVEELDRRVLARVADVRDLGALQSAVADGISEFGRLDIVSANAGIASFAPAWELSEETWQEMIDVNLTGVWKTCKAAIPAMLEAGNGGSIILTSSTAGLVAYGNLAHYTSAKHGVTGLMRVLAVELAQHGIRVNSVHPTVVDTDDGAEPGDLRPLHRRLGGDEGAGHRGLQERQRDPDPLAGPGRHLQRDPLAGLGRGALRHGHDPGRRRRRHPAVPLPQRRVTRGVSRVVSVPVGEPVLGPAGGPRGTRPHNQRINRSPYSSCYSLHQQQQRGGAVEVGAAMGSRDPLLDGAPPAAPRVTHAPMPREDHEAAFLGHLLTSGLEGGLEYLVGGGAPRPAAPSMYPFHSTRYSAPARWMRPRVAAASASP